VSYNSATSDAQVFVDSILGAQGEFSLVVNLIFQFKVPSNYLSSQVDSVGDLVVGSQNESEGFVLLVSSVGGLDGEAVTLKSVESSSNNLSDSEGVEVFVDAIRLECKDGCFYCWRWRPRSLWM